MVDNSNAAGSQEGRRTSQGGRARQEIVQSRTGSWEEEEIESSHCLESPRLYPLG